MDLLVKPVEERFARLTKALEKAKALYGSPPARWENECESAFSEFRVSCVHLRKDHETLDAVEDKQAAWRFICKFCRERPFWHDRCNEVLKILMKSDAWMKEFVEDPGTNIKDLPASIHEEFHKREQEVEPDKPKDADAREGRDPRERQGPGASDPKVGGPPPDPTLVLPELPTSMAVVVQRCVRAKILTDETAGVWGEIGRGLVVSVSFGKGVKEESANLAARFLLTARLSTAERLEPGKQSGHRVDEARVESKTDHTLYLDVTATLNQLIAKNGIRDVTGKQPLAKCLPDIAPGHRKKLVVRAGTETGEFLEHGGGPWEKAYDLSHLFAQRRVVGGGSPESVAVLGRRGEEQGILVMRQASLTASLGTDNNSLDYNARCEEEAAAQLYDAFVKALDRIGTELVNATPPPLPGMQQPEAPRPPKIVAGAFDGSGFLEMVSAGPFMHSFNF